jgi:hypothetical protein
MYIEYEYYSGLNNIPNLNQNQLTKSGIWISNVLCNFHALPIDYIPAASSCLRVGCHLYTRYYIPIIVKPGGGNMHMYPSAVHVADALLGQHERELEVLRGTQANKVKGQIDIKY